MSIYALLCMKLGLLYEIRKCDKCALHVMSMSMHIGVKCMKLGTFVWN